MEKATNLQIAKIKLLGVAFFANVLVILVCYCLKNVAYIKTCVEKQKKNPARIYKETSPGQTLMIVTF